MKTLSLRILKSALVVQAVAGAMALQATVVQAHIVKVVQFAGGGTARLGPNFGTPGGDSLDALSALGQGDQALAVPLQLQTALDAGVAAKTQLAAQLAVEPAIEVDADLAGASALAFDTLALRPVIGAGSVIDAGAELDTAIAARSAVAFLVCELDMDLATACAIVFDTLLIVPDVGQVSALEGALELDADLAGAGELAFDTLALRVPVGTASTLDIDAVLDTQLAAQSAPAFDTLELDAGVAAQSALAFDTLQLGTDVASASALNFDTLELDTGVAAQSAVAFDTLTLTPDVGQASALAHQFRGFLYRRGGNATAESAVGGRTDWASDANAISGTNGLHDGSSATFTGNVAGARGGQLELSYANFTGVDDQTIDYVKLHFYGNVTGTALNNADVQLRYDVGAGFVTLETITGNADFLTTPKTHDITAQILHWGTVDALRTAQRCDAALGETWASAADAIEYEIKADVCYIDDASGNKNHGLLLGSKRSALIASPWAGHGNALDFPGTDRNNASAGLVSPAISPVGIAAFTMECKVRRDRQNVTEIALAWANLTGSVYDAVQMLFSNVDNKLYVQVWDANVNTVNLVTPAAVANGVHNIAVSWNGATLYLYLNGTMAASAALASIPQVATQQLWLARVPWLSTQGGSPFPVDGAFDEVRFSNVERYGGANYTPATAPLTSDANTMLLWHMDALLS